MRKNKDGRWTARGVQKDGRGKKKRNNIKAPVQSQESEKMPKPCR